MKKNILKNAIKHWSYIEPLANTPKNKAEYEELVSQLDELLDIVGLDEKHPLIGLVDVVSDAVASYENKKHAIDYEGIDALKFLMQEHDLKQSDLSDIASQGVISEVLNGKRQLSISHIKRLSAKFNVSADTFL